MLVRVSLCLRGSMKVAVWSRLRVGYAAMEEIYHWSWSCYKKEIISLWFNCMGEPATTTANTTLNQAPSKTRFFLMYQFTFFFKKMIRKIQPKALPVTVRLSLRLALTGTLHFFFQLLSKTFFVAAHI
jgi:hypothetical protein